MRIYTRVEYAWSGGRYVIASSESYEYDGPLVRCTGGEEAAAATGAGKGAADATAGTVAGAGGELAAGGAAALPGAATAAGTGAAAAGAGGALGSGITPGTAGASGITPGAAGASGLSTTHAAGTALAPGFFASEGSILPGGTGGGAGAPSAAGADILPPQTPAAPGGTAAAPATGTPGGTGITPPPASGTPSATGLAVGEGGAAVTPTTGTTTMLPGEVGAPAATPSFVDQALKAMSQNKLATAGLGLNVLSQVQANRAGRSAADQLRANAAPVSAASKQLLEQGLAGKVPPEIMQQYQTSFQNRVAEINQRYANMGRDPKTDSAAQGEIAKAKQEMDAQVANYASSLVNQGLQAAGVASGPQTQAVIAGMQQDKELQAAMAGSLNSLALLQSLQRSQGAPGQ